ncbi:MAG: SIS domain-containing protein [Acidimicrobiales bacterium]
MTDFLYPFIDGAEVDAGSLLTDLAESARGKALTSRNLKVATLAHLDGDIALAAKAIARAVGSGGRMFAFGNGGSSTDAAGFVALATSPPWGQAIAARSLVDDTSILTALGNDVGFDLVFSRQLIAQARAGDVAIGFSTSGNSRNLMVAFTEARRAGMLRVGFAGYEGGEMAGAALDHCLVVRSESVHRIQEVQAALAYTLWQKIQNALQRVGDEMGDETRPHG